MIPYDRISEMLSYVQSYYRESRIYLNQNKAKGEEFNILRTLIDDLVNQFTPQTSTWLLKSWEEYCGIPVNESDSIEERRARVLSKISLITPMTPKGMETVVYGAVKLQSKIIDNIRPYTMQIVVYANGVNPINLDALEAAVEEAKPAHLAFEVCIEIKGEITVSADVEKYRFSYTPCGIALCGTIPIISTVGREYSSGLNINAEGNSYEFNYKLTGTIPIVSTIGLIEDVGINSVSGEQSYRFVYAPCGTKVCGN